MEVLGFDMSMYTIKGNEINKNTVVKDWMDSFSDLTLGRTKFLFKEGDKDQEKPDMAFSLHLVKDIRNRNKMNV